MYSANIFNQAQPTEPPLCAKTVVYPMDNANSAMSINARLPQLANNKQVGSAKKYVFIVLDNSGSMSGSAINQAKEAIKSFLPQIEDTTFTKLIVFNTFVKIYDLSVKTLQEKLRTVDSITSGGGTSFTNVFNEISKNIKETLPESDLSIIFFTDGLDMDGVNLRETAIRKMRETLLNGTTCFDFHTIGFTSEHDVKLLSDITKLGTSDGTFQYVKNASDIKASMENLVGFAQTSNLSGNVCIFKDGVPVHIEMVRLEKVGVEEDANFNAHCFLSNLVFTDSGVIKMELQLQRGKVTIPLNNLEHSESAELQKTSNVDWLALRLKFIEKSLITVANAISSNKKLDLKMVFDGNKKLERYLEEIRTLVQKIKAKTVRRELFAMLESIQDAVINFNSILAGAMVQSLSTDKIATLNSLAYKSVTKRGLQKKLDQRAQANSDLFAKLEKTVEDITTKMDFDALKNKYSIESIESTGTCVISCNNWLEALEQGDCLCLTLDVTRSQAAIADPSQVVVKAVGPSMMTAESFLDSVLYSLKNTQNPENVHGGFDRNATGSEVVTGLSRESITAVLPLYINDEHWSVAKQKMKPIMGFVATLDVMGYSFSQVRTIPFLVLAHLLKNNDDSEHHKNLIKLVSETCCQILKDCSTPGLEKKMSEEVLSLVTQYNTHPLIRTVDSIPNNEIFLMQIFCSVKCGFQMPTLDKLFYSNLGEEELRRTAWIKDPNIDFFNLLAISKSKWVDPYVQNFKKSLKQSENSGVHSSYALKITNRMNNDQRSAISATSTVTVCQLQSAPKTENNTNHDDLNSYPGVEYFSTDAVNLLSSLETDFSRRVAPLLNILNHVSDDTQKYTSLSSSLGVTELPTVLCLIIQTINHSKNAARRFAIEEGKYVSPFNVEECKQYIKKLFIKVVTDERQSQINHHLIQINNSSANCLAAIFGSSENATEAAGILLDTNRGDPAQYAAFVRSLHSPVPLLKEKWEMLTSGYHGGVKLFSDKNWKSPLANKNPRDLNPRPEGIWYASKKNLFRTWYANREQLNTADICMQVFPNADEILGQRAHYMNDARNYFQSLLDRYC